MCGEHLHILGTNQPRTSGGIVQGSPTEGPQDRESRRLWTVVVPSTHNPDVENLRRILCLLIRDPRPPPTSSTDRVALELGSVGTGPRLVHGPIRDPYTSTAPYQGRGFLVRTGIS